MAEDSDLERSERASPRRLEEARRRGQVARSRELSTFVLLMAGGGGLMLMASSLMERLSRLMRDSLSINRTLATDPAQLLPHLAHAAQSALLLVLPFLGLMLVAMVAGGMALSGWLFTVEPLAPNFARLNPVSGLGRLFSAASLVETGKSVLKAAMVALVAWWAVRRALDGLMALPYESPAQAIAHVGHLVGVTFLSISGSLLLLVVIDVPWQLFEYQRSLRMTKEEIKQEAKESEGDPQVKGRIRRLQREMARRRMMSEVPKADVVVVNPTRFAVALRYSDGMRAPEVLAAGHLLVAQAIRDLARDHAIPVVEAPPLARALYRHADVGREIPAALYAAVAELMAWVFQLRQSQAAGQSAPPAPGGIQVPPHLDPEHVEA